MTRLARIAGISIAVSLAVLALKLVAWRLTGSVALYSDALESVVNVATALMAAFAVRLAAQPPDHNHPYGHAKVELFAAMVEGGLIVVAAVLIFQEAWAALRHPDLPARPWLGIGMNALGSGLNGAWAFVLLRAGRRLHSPAVLADGRHLAMDVVASSGVAAGVALVWATGIARLDPALAVLVALYVLWSGVRVARAGAAGLMDEAPPSAVIRKIETLLAQHGTGALEAHDIRVRMAGRQTFLQFHLVVPGDMSVSEAHLICDRIERGILQDLPQMVTTIHVEPHGKAKPDAALRLGT